MAYGLDIDGVIYTTRYLEDIGVLTTYSINVDLADEKDFELTVGDFILPKGGFWYIEDTEFGGVIDGYKVVDESVVYHGRTFRGILDSTYIEELTGEGDVKELIENLIAQAGLKDSYFVVDEPEVSESIITETEYDFRVMDYTLYEAIMEILKSRDMTLRITYHKNKIHLTPILIQDYSEYMQYADVATLAFEMSVNDAIANHIICKDDDGRIIHIFADKNGEIQPYYTGTAYDDTDYILDKRNQKLFGIDERAEKILYSVKETKKYRPLTERPLDWDMEFGSYFYMEINNEGEPEYHGFQAIGEITYERVKTEPSDWSKNYARYLYKRWNPDIQDYEYVKIPSREVEREPLRIYTRPPDWEDNYTSYSYQSESGVGIVYLKYQSGTREYFIEMQTQPDGWNLNYSSYYRKVYDNIEYDSKGNKVVTMVDCIDHKDAYYVQCSLTDDGKIERVPDFYKRKHYIRKTEPTVPKFKPENTYYIGKDPTAPLFADFSEVYKEIKNYYAPPFSGAYKEVIDHYESMANDAVEYLVESRKQKTQRMILDNFKVSIGDIVGGKEEKTNTSIITSVKNITATIENGIIETDYETGG